MTRYGKPARPLAYYLAETETRFEDRGIHGGDLLYVDPDQPGDETDIVLVQLEHGLSFCPFNERPVGGQVLGPVVWIQPASFEPGAVHF